MPIEIKELEIRVAVSGAPPEGSKAVQSGAKGAGASSGAADQIVAECVEQVLRILQARKER
jgi:hypothetical protein